MAHSRPHAPEDDATGDVPAAAIATAYRHETDRLLRQRLDLTIALYLLFVGMGSALELAHAARAGGIVAAYLAEVLACLVALTVSRLPRRPPMRVVAAALGSVLAVVMTTYQAAVGWPAERFAMAQVCLLTGLVVILPWGVRAQLVVACASVASFVVAAPHLAGGEALAWAGIGLATGATTSICGARFLDAYRYGAFARSALLARASETKREEAEVAAVLLRVAETLNERLGHPDLLERITALSRDVLGCDRSSTFLWDEARQVFRLAANVGSDAALRAQLARLEFPRDGLPLFRSLRVGELIEVPDTARQGLVPVDLMRRTAVASALYVPIGRAGQIIGGFVHVYAHRTGPFTPKQRRLALGIAHVTAIGLENARLIADLQAASSLKSEFVSTMSHELRTPLNVIIGYTQMLAELVPPDPDTAGALEGSRRASLELLELVDSTLDLNRLDAGRDTVALGSCDVAGLFAELDRELRSLVPAGVALAWDAARAEPVLADRVKLKRILKNLAGNALKFTDAGEVEVHATTDGSHLTLTVRDTGAGIATGDVAGIFDMFRQVDGSATRRFGGVGLGLHIVKRLVDLLGGDVRVASTPGAGSTFTVVVPAPALAERRATGT